MGNLLKRAGRLGLSDLFQTPARFIPSMSAADDLMTEYSKDSRVPARQPEVKMAVMTSLVGRSEGQQAPAMGFQQWLQQGETLYQNALKEFHHIESQLEELDARLAAKLTELNQIASILGKAPIESTRRLSAQLVAAPANGVPAAL